MNYFLLNIVLALIWGAFTGVFSPGNLLIGFVLGYCALLTARRALPPSAYFHKVQQTLVFTVFFMKELILANLRVAADVVTPTHYMRPRVIAVPLDAKSDVEITALANLISLTPGTLTLDVSSDRRVLFLHAMYAADADRLRGEIKAGMERRLLAMTRGTIPARRRKP
jgi:multicomponent Na+:H+ antiporter subunit E